jgi:hypothetical protein
MTTIPVVFTRIKQAVVRNKHLDEKSKLIVLHLMSKIFKEIPREDLEYDKEFYPDPNDYSKSNLDDLGPFKDIFGDIFKYNK